MTLHPRPPARASPRIRRIGRPVPTFTLGVQTQSPTPSAIATRPPANARDQERFLVVSGSVLWRATAGICGGAAPIVEQSSDNGSTWTAATPGYLGVQQLVSLDAFASGEAQLVAGLVNCRPEALRTFTRGEFWEPSPPTLASSSYIDLTDPPLVHLVFGPRRRLVRTPQDSARRVVALVCDPSAYALDAAGSWTKLADDAMAVGVVGAGVLVAHSVERCNGLALSRYAGLAATPSELGCVGGADPTEPTAIADSPSRILVWSGGSLLTLPASLS